MHILLKFLIFIFLIIGQLFNNCSGFGSNRSRERDKFNKDKAILMVSTLNGNLHGIDVNNGKSLWLINNTPLVSQSLSNLEFVKDGKKFRLIPSLEGQLYMLEVDSDKKGLHALPITADALFTTSFQLSSDSLLVGGKEQRVLGFNPQTGEIKYRCGKDGCLQGPSIHAEREHCDLLLCRRISHVVRAVDLESGQEKWNFSVGQDEVMTVNGVWSYPKSPDGVSVEDRVARVVGGCVMSAEEGDEDDTRETRELGTQWSFDVERGVVRASSKAPFSMVRWEKELSAGLSRVWLVRGGVVRPLSIFARDAHSYVENGADDQGCPTRRSLFLGAHEGHLYVQLEDGSAKRSPRPAYVALSPSSKQGEENADKTGLVVAGRHRVSRVTRLVPITPNQGFFRAPLAEEEAQISKQWFLTQDNSECYPYASDPLVVRLGSFLFQKIALLCLVIVLAHLVFKKVYLPYEMAKMRGSGEMHSVAPVADTSKGEWSPPATPLVTPDQTATQETYVSRYETDYEHIRCLGRGAFGVVFEARHRVDQYHYAVKRVRVRDSGRARHRLLQEVQAFAHLEHPGIVRYYQAWFELPPDGWQERRDKELGVEDASEDEEGTATTNNVTNLSNDSDDRDWSISPITEVSKDAGAFTRGNSFVIFDRSLSLDHSVSAGVVPEKPVATMWAAQVSMSSGSSESSAVDGSSGGDNEGQTHSDTEAHTGDRTTQPSHIHLFISMHLYSGTTLQHRLQQRPRPPRHNLLVIFAQIVEAVAYLHRQELMHRDLKPSNILFDNTDHIRIVDFGLATPLIRSSVRHSAVAESWDSEKQEHSAATQHNDLHTSNVGTELYMSPEQSRGSQYDQKVDIFALGVIFLEMMVSLDTGMERVRVLTDARRLRFSASLRETHAEEVALASELLQEDPGRRPTCEDILRHQMLWEVCEGGAGVCVPHSRSQSLSQSSR